MCVSAVVGLETIQEQGPNSGLVQAFQQLSECQKRHCVHQLLTHSTSLAAVSSEELLRHGCRRRCLCKAAGGCPCKLWGHVLFKACTLLLNTHSSCPFLCCCCFLQLCVAARLHLA